MLPSRCQLDKQLETSLYISHLIVDIEECIFFVLVLFANITFEYYMDVISDIKTKERYSNEKQITTQ